MLLPPQQRQWPEGNEQQSDRRDEEPVDAAHIGNHPADQGADDLADRQEDAVEAHDRAPIGRKAFGDVGQQAEGRGCRTGEEEESERRGQGAGERDNNRQAAAMVDE